MSTTSEYREKKGGRQTSESQREKELQRARAGDNQGNGKVAGNLGNGKAAERRHLCHLLC